MSTIQHQATDYITCQHCQRDFRAITVRHLRNIHGYDGDHPILEYKRRFNLESAMCSEVRQKISEAKEDFWAKRGQGWTRRKLIAEIRRRHRSGKSLRGKQVPTRLYEAGRRFCGTWQAAVEEAGLNYEKTTGVRRWNPDKVVEEIQKLGDKGVSLNASHVWKRFPSLFTAARKQFPSSWEKALQAAGYDPDEHRQRRGRWNEQKAVDWVEKRLAKQRSVLARDTPSDLQDFVRNRLKKSWTDFIESFGISYPGVKKRQDWTEAKVLSEIRAWKRKGNRLNYRAVKLSYQALLQQAKKYFGSWDNARLAAGV
ncbi:MAG: hypothetical protein IID46_08340 [Planctomycetes bacterium]|nr:hypothetical protein [Planctomycetota bacterium]